MAPATLRTAYSIQSASKNGQPLTFNLILTPSNTLRLERIGI